VGEAIEALPPQDHGARRDALRRLLVDADVGALLATDPVSVRYLSGFHGSNGQVVVTADRGGDRLITDERYAQRAAAEAPDLEVVLTRDPVEVGIEVAAAAGERLGLEADHLTWAEGEGTRRRARARDVRVAATTGLVASLRVVKDTAEIARLALACALTERALEWLVAEVVAPGATERELATALERRFVDTGADGVAFDSIVASGPNAAIPHHSPGDRPLAPGDLLTIDCGALVDGYHADHTRTYALGHLDDELVEVHRLVVRAQEAGRTAVRAGALAGDVDAAARAVVEAAGRGEAFLHGTGHGVGLEIHEAPAVGVGGAATLRAGTTLTVEPGVYLPGRGGVRIEDTLLVTADGPARPLTDTPRDLRVL
jgi:Xaa-Pro aminopeptidase